MLGRLVNDRLKTMQPEEAWGDLLPHLAQADLRIVNLECALTNHLGQWARSEKMFHFRADPGAVRRPDRDEKLKTVCTASHRAPCLASRQSEL